MAGSFRSPVEAASGGDPEAALVTRIAAGDQRVFAEFYGLNRRRLARFLGRFLTAPEIIDELINDVMFVVWQDARLPAAHVRRPPPYPRPFE